MSVTRNQKPADPDATARRVDETERKLEANTPGRPDPEFLRDEAREIVALKDSFDKTLEPRQTGAEPPEEPTLAVENQGEFPGLADQGEGFRVPRNRPLEEPASLTAMRVEKKIENEDGG